MKSPLVRVLSFLRAHPAAVLWWLVCLYTALTLYGFYQEDEFGQITAFYLHKAGIVGIGEMPW